jgi:hypothetical protein
MFTQLICDAPTHRCPLVRDTRGSDLVEEPDNTDTPAVPPRRRRLDANAAQRPCRLDIPQGGWRLHQGKHLAAKEYSRTAAVSCDEGLRGRCGQHPHKRHDGRRFERYGPILLPTTTECCFDPLMFSGLWLLHAATGAPAKLQFERGGGVGGGGKHCTRLHGPLASDEPQLPWHVVV